MTATFSIPTPLDRDPYLALRAYHALAPWSLRDLSAIAVQILEASGVVPLNVAARTRPTDRTIRFYVARGLVSPPDGRGTAAVYGYRHLLQVLAIKLRQMDGASLEQLKAEFGSVAGDMLERRVASALGPALPAPDQLDPATASAPRGRMRRALGLPPSMASSALPARSRMHGLVRRVPLDDGAELLLDADHPLFRLAGAERVVAEQVGAVLRALAADLDAPAH